METPTQQTECNTPPIKQEGTENIAGCDNGNNENVKEQKMEKESPFLRQMAKNFNYEFFPRPALPICNDYCSPYLSTLVWGKPDFFIEFNKYENMMKKQIDLEIDKLCTNEL